MSNTKVHFGFPLEYVTDIDASKRFFVEVLGLYLERDHPTFVQFKDDNGARYAIATDAPMERADVPELWWVVEDAHAALTSMSAGAEISMPLREMPFGTCF